MSKQIEAMKQALEALELLRYAVKDSYPINASIAALREALAEQPAQEPVAWRFTGVAGFKRYVTQAQYAAFSPEIRKSYEPYKCANCRPQAREPEQPAQQEPDELIHIDERDCLIDVNEDAWRTLIENRGGCRCHISPPCGACSNPISEEEMNEVGYTYTRPPAREPLTRDQVKALTKETGYDTASTQERADFINGIRHAEAAHGIISGEATTKGGEA